MNSFNSLENLFSSCNNLDCACEMTHGVDNNDYCKTQYNCETHNAINISHLFLNHSITSKEVTDDNEICSEKYINTLPLCDNYSVITIL